MSLDSVEKDCLNSGHDCQLQEVSGTEVSENNGLIFNHV